MSRKTESVKTRDWYSVSVTAVQQLFTVIGLILLVVVGLLAFQWWDRYRVQIEAEKVVAEATAITEQLKGREDYVEVRRQNRDAWVLLEEARTELEKKDYPLALDHGNHSLGLLRRVLNNDDSVEGTIRVLTVQGGVEFRRGERGAWRRARSQDSLNPGDWVKTSGDGTAEILFPDGTVYTLRQSTMINLGSHHSSERSTRLLSGLVKLNTGQSGSRVSTPKSEATLRSETEALVAFDENKGRGSFGVYSGELEVRSSTGQMQRVGALQQVDQVGDMLTDVKVLPDKPKLLHPTKDDEFPIETSPEVQLAWQPTPGTQRYALQVSSSPLFASNIIDDTGRSKAAARLGVKGEGAFYWQVAAIDSNGLQGPWSDAGTFRITSQKAFDQVDDKTPPALEILSSQVYGSLVIVNGRTEPGSGVTINGESVTLNSDGTFSKTVQMDEAGWGFVEVVSTDVWDNAAYERIRVFVDAI